MTGEELEAIRQAYEEAQFWFCVEAVPALLDEIERLRAALDRVLAAGWGWTDEYEAARVAAEEVLGGVS